MTVAVHHKLCFIIKCWFVVQVENSDEHQWDVPVVQHEENLSIVEAYNDRQLQPVVVIKRLDDTT